MSGRLFQGGGEVSAEGEAALRRWALRDQAEEAAAFDAEERPVPDGAEFDGDDYDPADVLCREIASPVPRYDDLHEQLLHPPHHDERNHR